MNRHSILFLALLLSLEALTACNDPAAETEPAADSEETVTVEETAVETDAYGREIPAYPLAEIPSFGGYDIRMLSRDLERWYIDFGTDELTGELVNDAVYNRNLMVEADLDVKFSRILVDCGDHTAAKTVMTNYQAGDTAYDIAGLYQLYHGSVCLAGAFKNMYDVPFVDFGNIWWNASFRDELTYDGKLFYAIGDMNVSVTSTLMGVFFNQNKFVDYYGDPENLYELVREGKWTKDAFEEYLSGTYVDLNGNGTKEMDDFVGFILDEADIGPWLPAFDIRLCIKDDSGTPQLSYYNEKSVDAHYWMYDLFLEHPDVYFAPKNSGYMDAFKNDRALFAIIKFDDAATVLRDMESTYGVVPMPKWDEEQDGYYNAAHDNSNLMGVIQNTQNVEAVGAALELMNYYSYLNVTPAYFEVALKSKYFHDSDSAEMFEIIRQGAVVDFGQIYSLAIGGGSYSFDTTYHLLSRNQIRNKNRDIASRYMQNETLYQNALEEVLAQYREMK